MITNDPTTTSPVQPGPRSPKHSRTFRVLRAGGISVAAIIAVSIIAGSLAGHKTTVTTTPAPPASTSASAAHKAATPVPTVTVTAAPAPAVTVTAAPAAAAAPPADTILARFHGSGSGSTGTFTVPADGNWHLSWAYANGTLFAGQSENFQVYEYGTDGTLSNVLVNALAVGSGQPTALPVYSDSLAGGTAYLQVNTEDAQWWLVVVSGTS